MATNQPPLPGAGALPRSAVAREPEPVKLWSWPKIIFLYPTLLAAIVAGVGSTQWQQHATTWGVVFMVTFFVNLVVMAFDFPRTTSLTLLLLAVAVGLGGVLLNQRYDYLPALTDWTRRIDPRANSQFYFLVAGSLALVYLVVLIIDFRFDHWTVYPNEIIHRRGILGNVSRYPAPGLELQKEIDDVFEYLLFGSGRLVIQPTRGPAIVLENVFRVNAKASQIQQLLDALSVEISPTDPVARMH